MLVSRPSAPSRPLDSKLTLPCGSGDRRFSPFESKPAGPCRRYPPATSFGRGPRFDTGVYRIHAVRDLSRGEARDGEAVARRTGAAGDRMPAPPRTGWRQGGVTARGLNAPHTACGAPPCGVSLAVRNHG